MKAVITTFSKFAGSDHTIFLLSDNNYALGFLKVGNKKLFHRDAYGKVFELSILSVLDFYVHESVQRNGYGKVIFEKFLQEFGVHPRRLAYDRPSGKLIGFLKKHYGLSKYVPQNNNFVIFDDYFQIDDNDFKERNLPKQTPSSTSIPNKEYLNSNSNSIPPSEEILQ